jgi:hypothetical protein
MKQPIIYVLPVILVMLTYAYSNTAGKQGIVIEKRPVIPEIPVAALIQQIRPQSQRFKLKADADQLISGKGGTRIFIPWNSFVNAEGEIVTGEVDIELIEVLSVADLIQTNLQTVSNGRPLQSEGMFYIDVQSNGMPLAMAPGKQLQVELPRMNNVGGASDTRIFSGAYDSSGQMNWSESGSMDARLIPLPLEVFNYRSWLSHNFERTPDNVGYTYMRYSNDPTEEDLDPEEIVDSTSFQQKALENTFIATREFEERFRYIQNAEWAIGQYTSYYTTTVKRGRMVKDSNISLIYLNNLNKDLWYCDSLAYNYIKSWVNKDGFKGHIYGEFEPINLLEVFRKFYEKRAGNTYKFPKDIDLNSSSAREKLLANGYEETEADQLLGAYKRQQEIIIVRRNKKTSENILVNSFAIAKLGWINCDQFYDDPAAKEASIMAAVNPELDASAALSLVINGRRVALGGMHTDNSKFTFTGKKEPYTQLPIRAKATIIAISYKDKKPYLGIQEITISEKAEYTINLKASSVKDIQEKLKEIR